MRSHRYPFVLCILFFVTAGISACSWSTGVFEKNISFPRHEWPAADKPVISFTMEDTASAYNVFIVIRHTDAYHFNNMFVRLGVTEPGATAPHVGDYDLQLTNNGRGWLGTAMDDIYESRILIQPRTHFHKAGTYHIQLEQLMREDPLKNVLSAGLRLERIP